MDWINGYYLNWKDIKVSAVCWLIFVLKKFESKLLLYVILIQLISVKINLQVFVAALLKRKQVCPSNPNMLQGSQTSNDKVALSSASANLISTQKFRQVQCNFPILKLLLNFLKKLKSFQRQCLCFGIIIKCFCNQNWI